MAELTKSQIDTLRLVRDWTASHGSAPRAQDIADLRQVSRQNISACVKTLRKRALLEKPDRSPLRLTTLGDIVLDCREDMGQDPRGPVLHLASSAREAVREALTTLHLPATVDQLHEACTPDGAPGRARPAVLAAARAEGLSYTRHAVRCPGCGSKNYVVYTGELTRDWLCGPCTGSQEVAA